MLRVLLIFIFLLIVFAGVVLYLTQTPGFASFNYGDITIELPLVKFVFGLFIAFAIFYLIIRVASLLLSAPKRIHTSTLRRKRRKSMDDTKKGLTKFVLGDWAQSEKLLLRGADSTSTACVNYTWAAHAAHQAGKYEARDYHFSMAKKCAPEARAALNVLQAGLLLDQGLPKQALVSLNQQSNKIRSSQKIATLFANAYMQLGDWQKLAELIPDLHRVKGIDKQFLKNIEKFTVQGLLHAGKPKIGSEAVENISSRFKHVIFSDSELAVSYVKALRQQGKYETAETLIANALENNWDPSLVRQYGLLKLRDANYALKKAEQWTQHHTNDANLYLTLGRLCKHAQLLDKAKAYLESSLSRKPLAETYAELAALHERFDEPDAAHRCMKKGLKLSVETV
jgi:HemY protein